MGGNVRILMLLAKKADPQKISDAQKIDIVNLWYVRCRLVEIIIFYT